MTAVLALPPTVCRHCNRTCGARVRRGLCRACYADPAVRAAYHQTGSLAGLCGQSTNDRDVLLRHPCLPEPTAAPPGTQAKVAVLAERARLRQALFVRGDVQQPVTALWQRRCPDAQEALLWRTLALHDPSILDDLAQLAALRRQAAQRPDPPHRRDPRCP